MTSTGLLLPIVWAITAASPFVIEVVDSSTGRGVPLVELRTTNDVRLITDSAGLAAFDEPGLMDGQSVFFHVSSHGYEYPADGFGYRGKALKVIAGASARLEVRRVNIAERLYRVTGAGIYRDSILAGRPAPIRQPVLNAQVFGSDSVLNAVYRGRIYWFWGDTNRPGYPLGNFHVPGATSLLPANGGLDPDRGVDLTYFTGPDGFARPTAQLPGPGPTWLGGLFVLNDPADNGRERLFAGYAKIKPPLETYERGLVEFDPESSTFRKVATYPIDAPNYPTGQAFVHRAGTADFVYFATAYPWIRVRAEPEALRHPDRFETFTCLAPQGLKDEPPRIERDPMGRPRWAWTSGAPAVSPAIQAQLIRSRQLAPGETIGQLRDLESGRPIVAHNGSVNWNDYRRRFVMIVCEAGGTSFLGETWYAEADTPLGPWVYARKVVTHDRYSFYNPKQHPMFDQDGGRLIYFEGTYTHTFSGNDQPTPRYDYNQVMYRLDLSDLRLNLPVAIYQRTRGGLGTFAQLGPDDNRLRVAFFALERPGPGTVAVRSGEFEFHALAPDTTPAPGATVLLYRRGADDPTRVELVTEDNLKDEERRASQPIGRVWRNPLAVALPRD